MFIYDERYVSKKEGCYYSCPWIEHGLVFFKYKIAMCCNCAHSGEQNLLRNNYIGQRINWERIFKIKDMYRNYHKKGKIHTGCINCPMLKEAQWDSSRYIDNLYILRAGGMISFGGGEPTLLDEFEDIMNFFLDNYFWGIRVHTSGIKYSQALARAISEIRGYVVVSVDSGDRETFKEIKRVDKFDEVRETIRKYALQTNYIGRYLVSAKYIIIPGINDTKEQIEKWLTANYNAGLYTTVLDLEENWYLQNRNNIPKHIFELIKYAEKRAKQLKSNFEIYERLQNVVKDFESKK